MSPMQKFIRDLKKAGFRVWIPGGADNWVYFSFDDKLAYAQYSKTSGWSFTTVHVPCERYGSGFAYYRVKSDLVETAKSCCLTLVPFEFGNCDVKKPRLESWIKKNPLMKEVEKCDTKTVVTAENQSP